LAFKLVDDVQIRFLGSGHACVAKPSSDAGNRHTCKQEYRGTFARKTRRRLTLDEEKGDVNQANNETDRSAVLHGQKQVTQKNVPLCFLLLFCILRASESPSSKRCLALF
jgi:hypothetical protein